jgi:hypothetical protein
MVGNPLLENSCPPQEPHVQVTNGIGNSILKNSCPPQEPHEQVTNVRKSRV